MWRCVGLFRHGGMADVEYAYRVYRTHLEQSEIAARAPFTMLELGPGDSALSAVFACAHRVGRSLLVDVANCAERDPEVYYRVAKLLRERRLPAADLDGSEDFAAVWDKCRVDYLTGGLQSLRSVSRRKQAASLGAA